MTEKFRILAPISWRRFNRVINYVIRTDEIGFMSWNKKMVLAVVVSAFTCPHAKAESPDLNFETFTYESAQHSDNNDFPEILVEEQALRAELEKEKYKTAIVREKVKRMTLERQVNHLNQKEEAERIIAKRVQEDQSHGEDLNDLEALNGLVSTIGNIAVQARAIANFTQGGGW